MATGCNKTFESCCLHSYFSTLAKERIGGNFNMYTEKRKTKKGWSHYVHIEYRDVYGRKQKYSKGGFKTKKEALEHGLRKENELLKGIDIKQKKYTLNEVYEDYMKVVGKFKLSPNSKRIYSDMYKNYIKEDLGMVCINDIHYRNLQEFFNRIDRSMSTCKMIKTVLSNTFKYAIRNGYIESNPINGVETRGNGNIKKVESITSDEFNTIIEYTLKPNIHGKTEFHRYSYVCTFYVGYYLGLRISEALALNKSDFDFNANTVTINKQLVSHGLKKEDFYTTNQMKTRTSKAVLPLPNILRDILMQWFKKNPYEIAFPDENGLYLNPMSIDAYIRIARKKLGINFYFHSFRHSCASNLVKSGVDVVTASKYMRHSNPTTTLNVYTDAKNEDVKRAIESAFDSDLDKKPHSNLTEVSLNALN